MKFLISISLLLSLTIQTKSQSLNNSSALISYNLFLHDEVLPANSTDTSHTKLNSDQMSRIYKAFYKYIESNPTAPNYGYLDPNVNSLGINSIVTAKNNPLAMIEGNYLHTYELSNRFVAKDNKIYLGEQLLVDNNELILKRIIANIDPVTGEDTKEVVEKRQALMDALTGMNFIEAWTYNSKTKMFQKQIGNSGLVYKSESPDGSPRNDAFLSLVPNNKPIADKKQLLKENMIYDVDFLGNYETLEEGVVEIHEYLQPQAKFKLFFSIFSDIKSGKLKVLEYPENSDLTSINISNLKEAEADEFFASLSQELTSVDIDPTTGEEIKTVFTMNATINDISSIRFIEDWYLDDDNLNLYKKVKAIIFLTEKIDFNAGVPLGLKPISPYLIVFE